MTNSKLLHAITAVALTAASTVALANDSDATETSNPSAMIVAMGDTVGQPQTTSRDVRAHSHGRQAAPHTARSPAPLVASERPPRPPIAVVKSTGRPEAAASRVGAGHMFPPRGFPKW
jgi:hypothetical protein